jgi:glycosyltransferase involved in cell wall biosynthesis
MSKGIGVFTIASKNYLAYARVLLKSVAKLHPEYSLYLCLVDRVDGYFDAEAEPFTVVQADALGIPTFDDMAVRYDIMEFNTAVKPSMFQWLFRTTGLDSVIYLDPDIRVYSRLDAIEDALKSGASVVLTPHITKPVEDGKSPNDYHMLQAGVFNLGFAAVRRSQEGESFVAWWGRRLATMATADLSKNLFTDQRWCDLAPCFLDDLKVLKHPAYNVAYWNLLERDVRFDGTTWRSNGNPLAFFHFSGINASKGQLVSKHQDRFDWTNLPQCRPLFDEYRESLIVEGWDQTSKWPYAYSEVNGKFKVPSIVRRLYRDTFSQPQTAARSSVKQLLIDLCNAPARGVAGNSKPEISQLMELTYRLRPDLQAAFSLTSEDGRRQFSDWFVEAASREYGLPDEVVPKSQATPVGATQQDLASHAQVEPSGQATTIDPTCAVDRQTLQSLWRSLPTALKREAAPLFKHWIVHGSSAVNSVRADASTPGTSVPPFSQRIKFLAAPAELEQLVPGQSISTLMHMIWRSRPDLQQAFDLAKATGQSGFIGWFDASAAQEYGLPRTGERLPSVTEPLGTKSALGQPGVNLVGYAHAEIGMGEHVRMTAAALSETAVAFGVLNFNVGVPSRQAATLEHGELMVENKFAANLFHINADQMLNAYCRLGPDFFSARYNIGYWAWELAKCPDDWVPVTGMMDEIWAPSRFIQEAFAAKTSIPVEYMPLCVTLPAVPEYGRQYFGLPDRSFIFLYTFDFLSYFDRKNPFAAIRAFKAAFPRQNGSVALVLKVMNGDTGSAQWRQMTELIDGDPRIIILNKTLDRHEVVGLIDLCDCFVSLHRSEGFGRGPAEAMYLGKPVIVTNYSGNTDFTLPDNSCLVDYKLVPVGAGQYPFHQGQVWADADVEHAAWFMKKVCSDTQFASEIATKGRDFIHENFNQRKIGSMYAERLKKLHLA